MLLQAHTLQEIEDFRKLIAAHEKKTSPGQQKFVKQLTDIPTEALLVSRSCKTSLNLVVKGLIGQFTRLWPSTRAIEAWIKRN